MATLPENVQQVLALLPTDGTEMPYHELEQKAIQAPIDKPRDALRYIIKQNLIGKRLTADKYQPTDGSKPFVVVMVKRQPR